jgi:hypothetical protein
VALGRPARVIVALSDYAGGWRVAWAMATGGREDSPPWGLP